MVRKLALAVSLALGTVSVPAHALGLGELSSKSGLNQNFKGDIALLSVVPEELDGIRVQMADADAFARAGVERPFYLSLLKFEPVLTPNGRPVIRVSSDFPIQEPFLNFLIEVNWPNGRMMREYTVLLDPPTTTTRRPAAVARATQTPRPAQAAPTRTAAPAPQATAPAAAASVSGSGSEYGPVQANETAWSIAKQVRPRGVSMEQMMIALLNANPQAFVDGNINRLRRGQILRVPPTAEIQELTRQAARQAYREQQDEWLARRNERLQQAAEAEPTEDAAAEADVAATTTGAAAQSRDQLRIATARPDGEGEAGAGDDADVATAAGDLKSRLLVARENAESSRQEAETLRSQVDDLQARLENMQRLLSLKDEQLAQLQDRIVTDEVSPEAPVAAATEAAGEAGPAEDDVQLANQIDLNAEAEADAVAETADAVAPPADYTIEEIPPRINPDRIVEAASAAETGGTGIAAIPPQIDADKVVEAFDGGVTGQPVESEQPVAAGILEGGELVVIEDDAAPLGTEAPVEEPVSAESEASVIEPVAAEDAPESAVADGSASLIPPSVVRTVEENVVPIAAGGLALLGLVGWLALRRRREDGGDEPALAAVAAAPAAEETPAVDKPAAGSEILDDLADSSFLDEFAPSDINALQEETGEVDPVSEADVYIAYGRYQQAEELLRQAMERDPDRLALKHKLLEVHYATRDAGAYAALAQAMADAGEDSVDEEAWLRAQDMGRELDAGNPLFAAKGADADLGEPTQPQATASPAAVPAAAAAGAAVAAAGAAAADADDDADDTLSLDDLELSELTAAYDEQTGDTAGLEVPSEVSVLLDLDESAEPVEASSPDLPESISLDELEDVDFALPQAETAETPAAEVESEDQGSDSVSLESMMSQAEAAIDGDESSLSLDSALSAEELQAQLDDLSDLSILDSELEERADEAGAKEPPALGLVAEDKPAELEGIDQPISLDEAFEEDEASSEGAEIVPFEGARSANASGDADEVTTKLDLARAYVEMGDEDGARSILEEVVAEGDDSQRGDAERLLGKLG